MNFFNTIVRPAFALLGPHYRKKGLILLPLLLLQSFMDVLSVASFAPMALLIVRPGSIHSNTTLLRAYEFFSFQNERSFVPFWVAGIGLLFIVKYGLNSIITRLKARYAFDVSAALSLRALYHFIDLPYAEYVELQSGNEQTKVAQLPVSFANNILLGLTTLITEGLIVVLLVITLTLYDWHSVFFLVVLLVPAVIFYKTIQKKLRSTDESLRTDYPGLIRQLTHFFQNFIEIKLYHKTVIFIDNIKKRNQALHRAQVLQTVLQSDSFRLFETAAAMGLCLLIFYCLLSGISPDDTVVLLGLYTAAGFRSVPSFNRIFVALLQIRMNEHVLKGLSKLTNPTPGSEHHPDVSFKSSVELKNISFGFHAGLPILQNVNLTISRGQRIALTGQSGSGKTTLLLIIMRFLTETTGEIMVDGIPVKKEPGSWRRHLAYVPQDPVIFDGSLLENIAFGIEPATVDQTRVIRLLQLLGLGAWMAQLPDGLQTRLGDRGVKLSGGQRQRLAIARALYSDRELLLFDEATSQVDSITEKEIYEALKAEGQQAKTLIMVTHRVPSPHYFDKVFHLQGGRLQDHNFEPVH